MVDRVWVESQWWVLPVFVPERHILQRKMKTGDIYALLPLYTASPMHCFHSMKTWPWTGSHSCTHKGVTHLAHKARIHGNGKLIHSNGKLIHSNRKLIHSDWQSVDVCVIPWGRLRVVL